MADYILLEFCNDHRADLIRNRPAYADQRKRKFIPSS